MEKNIKIEDEVHRLLKIESGRRKLSLGETIRSLIPDDTKALAKK
jgi:predicted CopG family antitoxin